MGLNFRGKDRLNQGNDGEDHKQKNGHLSRLLNVVVDVPKEDEPDACRNGHRVLEVVTVVYILTLWSGNYRAFFPLH